MKFIICSALAVVVIMTLPMCTSSSRIITTNAVMQQGSTSKISWGLPQPPLAECLTEEAIVRAASMEDKLRVRSTTYALRQIEPSVQRIPQTELDFLESSYGLAKSIR